jgi:hypothetical protein
VQAVGHPARRCCGIAPPVMTARSHYAGGLSLEVDAYSEQEDIKKYYRFGDLAPSGLP